MVSDDGGITFEALHHLNCLEGPDPACAEGTTIAEICPGPWGATKQTLQTDTCEDGGTGGAGGASGRC